MMRCFEKKYLDFPTPWVRHKELVPRDIWQFREISCDVCKFVKLRKCATPLEILSQNNLKLWGLARNKQVICSQEEIPHFLGERALLKK